MSGRRIRGFTLAETSIALGIVGILSLVGVSTLDFGCMDLLAVQEDLRGAIQQGFHLARARGSNVVVEVGNPGMKDVLPVALPQTVHWGKPEGIPVPPGMDEPKNAATSGQAHARITITPRHTATASAWFLHNGRDVLCMRLSGKGHLQMLRWHHRTRTWGRV